MKRLLLLWLFSGSLDCFCQVAYDYNKGLSTGWASHYSIDSVVGFTDTVRAMLHVSFNRPRHICYNLLGYVVLSSESDPVYLDDKHIKLSPDIIVWQYKINPPLPRRVKQ